MKYKIYLTSILIVIGFLSFLPKTASAFLWFGQKKTTAPTVKIEPQSLTEVEKINADNKYKVWEESFEKKNIEAVIANQDKFSFTVSEINYLLDLQGRTAKKPSITKASITSSSGNVNVTATFHKFISGHFSFIARASSVNNKINLQLSSVKLYGIPVPAKWLSTPLNKELDRYFSFLYQDSRYQGFSVNVSDTILEFKPDFKK